MGCKWADNFHHGRLEMIVMLFYVIIRELVSIFLFCFGTFSMERFHYGVHKV